MSEIHEVTYVFLLSLDTLSKNYNNTFSREKVILNVESI